jgi:hypothetical protein
MVSPIPPAGKPLINTTLLLPKLPLAQDAKEPIAFPGFRSGEHDRIVQMLISTSQ